MTLAASAVDHLETPRLPLRVKRKVKSRYKPISDPNTGSATSQIAMTPERWPGNTAYEMPATIASENNLAVISAREMMSAPALQWPVLSWRRQVVGLEAVVGGLPASSLPAEERSH